MVLPRARLDDLIGLLRRQGYQVVGPAERDGVLRLVPVECAAELAQGWQDRQSPGRYRLEHDPQGPVFAACHGPDSARTFLQPPREVLFRTRRGESGLVFEAAPVEAPPTALLGLRACDVQARLIQDRVLL